MPTHAGKIAHSTLFDGMRGIIGILFCCKPIPCNAATRLVYKMNSYGAFIVELRVQAWGNSAAIRLPTPLLRHLNVSAGDKLIVEVCDGGIILKPKGRTYSLDALLAQCDENAPPPKDLAAWDAPKALGNEA